MTTARTRRAATVVDGLGLGLLLLGWVAVARAVGPGVRLARGVDPASVYLAPWLISLGRGGLAIWAGWGLSRLGAARLWQANVFALGAVCLTVLAAGLKGGPLTWALAVDGAWVGIPIGALAIAAHPALRMLARQPDPSACPGVTTVGAWTMLHETAVFGGLLVIGAPLWHTPLEDPLLAVLAGAFAGVYGLRIWLGVRIAGRARHEGGDAHWARWHRAAVVALAAALAGGVVIYAWRGPVAPALIAPLAPWVLALHVWPSLAWWRVRQQGSPAGAGQGPAGPVVVGLLLVAVGAAVAVTGVAGGWPIRALVLPRGACGGLGLALALGGGGLVVGRRWGAVVAGVAAVGGVAAIIAAGWRIPGGVWAVALAALALMWVAGALVRGEPRGWPTAPLWFAAPFCMALAAPFLLGLRSVTAPATTPGAPVASTPASVAHAPATEPPSADPQQQLIDRGEALFAQMACADCHSVDGSPSVGPTLAGLAGRTVRLTGGRVAVADTAYLQRALTAPQADVPKGFPPSMPSYVDRLRGVDLAAVVLFMQSLGDDEAETR